MTSPAFGYDVIGLGVSTLDLLMLVDDFPGQEVVLRSPESTLQGGGPVATAMVTLARLGARTAMVDRVGDDWRGESILEEFRREGVATEYVAVENNATSSIASVLVRKRDGARAIIYAPGNAPDVVAADLPDDLLPSSKVLHVNGRHPAACIALARKAKEHGVAVSFDGGAHRFREELKEIVSLSDICIVARDFAFAFSGAGDVAAAAANMLESGPSIAVVTAGTDGSWVFAKDGESFHQPAFTTEAVVDTTGAGDAYHGAFLFGMVRQYTLRNCALLASAVATMNTTRLGGRAALPSFHEALLFLRSRGIDFQF